MSTPQPLDDYLLELLQRDADAVDGADGAPAAAGDLAPVHAGEHEEQHQEGKDEGGDLASGAAEDSHHTDGPAGMRGSGEKEA